jgi:hypothetical protein
LHQLGITKAGKRVLHLLLAARVHKAQADFAAGNMLAFLAAALDRRRTNLRNFSIAYPTASYATRPCLPLGSRWWVNMVSTSRKRWTFLC